ncbi:MAG: class I SAM-dependent methyltransferase [Elusimicrobia bacterium]|nr:class I SAM-dependent methyltransferase [Elusimicrobiota bacterium]
MRLARAGLALYRDGAFYYDLLFSWDVQPEVDWLLERMGRRVRTVLEPACGSGRIFPGFAKRGVEVVGVDISADMLRRARKRMRDMGLPAFETVRADMADFELRRSFDGAVCPINSFGYLATREAALSHLACVARHLKPGARYLVQLDLRNLMPYRRYARTAANRWESGNAGVRARIAWDALSFDPGSRIETQVSTIEVLSGPEKGRRLRTTHPMRLWSREEWANLLADSPFRETAAYDGGRDGRPRMDFPLPAEALLAWHELRLRRP